MPQSVNKVISSNFKIVSRFSSNSHFQRFNISSVDIRPPNSCGKHSGSIALQSSSALLCTVRRFLIFKLTRVLANSTSHFRPDVFITVNVILLMYKYTIRYSVDQRKY
uniref:Uncharacterized protein n=1 Tax=Glossina austeni TaxID=7395 RepID=A0A1A9VDV6_GLOAU